MSTVTAVPIPPTKRRYLTYLWAGVLLALVAAVALAQQGTKAVAPTIGFQVLRAGDHGAHPTDTDIALVQYEGRLTNGTVFDKSAQPTPFPVTGVIPGFTQGLKQMEKGGKYRLTIPPQLGYGDKATGPIPPNSTLVFDVELIDFKSEAEIRQMQQQQMMLQQMMQQRGAGAGGAGDAVPATPGSQPNR